MIKKIVLFGPESTGKSTLSKKLAKHYKTIWNPEFVRSYLDVKNAIAEISNPKDKIVLEKDIEPIAIGQLATENNLSEQANKLLFCDTNLLATKIYSKYYFGFCPQWIIDTSNQIAKNYFYLLLNIDTPFINDSQRDSNQNRAEIYQLFKNELITNNLSFKEINGHYEERLQKCISIINKL